MINLRIKVLVIQAENDDGDMAEMRDGVQHGMIASGLFSEAESGDAARSVHTFRVTSATGEKVGALLSETTFLMLISGRPIRAK